MEQSRTCARRQMSFQLKPTRKYSWAKKINIYELIGPRGCLKNSRRSLTMFIFHVFRWQLWERKGQRWAGKFQVITVEWFQRINEDDHLPERVAWKYIDWWPGCLGNTEYGDRVFRFTDTCCQSVAFKCFQAILLSISAAEVATRDANLQTTSAKMQDGRRCNFLRPSRIPSISVSVALHVRRVRTERKWN